MEGVVDVVVDDFGYFEFDFVEWFDEVVGGYYGGVECYYDGE